MESGLTFLNVLFKNKLIFNLYLFKSSTKLGTNGFNNSSAKFIKELKSLNRVKVNLNGENLYKVKIK